MPILYKTAVFTQYVFCKKHQKGFDEQYAKPFFIRKIKFLRLHFSHYTAASKLIRHAVVFP